MYSLMNVGINYFYHLHAEQVLSKAMEKENDQLKKGMLEETIDSSVISTLLLKALKKTRIFIDTSGLLKLDSIILQELLDAIQILSDNENEIYCLGNNEIIKETIKKGFSINGFMFQEDYCLCGFWYLEKKISNENQNQNIITVKQYSELIYEIHEKNLKNLIEDGPKGKYIDLKRNLKDGKKCIYYYLYRLIQRMIEENIISKDPLANRDICLVGGNDAGYYAAEFISLIAGTDFCALDTIQDKLKEIKKYIMIRDVIHMFCEMNKITTLIEGQGGIVCGTACLIDINTGVGNRKNRVSLYTIDLQKGISYRLHHKKTEYSCGNH